jgi:hypothetical protein
VGADAEQKGGNMENVGFRVRAEAATVHPAASLNIERGADGRLCASLGNEQRVVRVHRCFPWSEPDQFISLRDDDGEEFALVSDPGELSVAAQSVLLDALGEAGFIFDVAGVGEIEEEVELRNWLVRTNQGARRFQTRLDDWPRKLPDGGLLIRDVTGDFYRISDPGALDRKSRALLWAFVD